MACQVSGTLQSHGDPSLRLLSIQENGFYVHREVTLTLRLAQGKQTGIIQIKILPTSQLKTKNSYNESLVCLLENVSRSRQQAENLQKPVRSRKPSRMQMFLSRQLYATIVSTNHCPCGEEKFFWWNRGKSSHGR